QQRHAGADGQAGDAAVERVGGDDRGHGAVRLHFDDLGAQTLVVEPGLLAQGESLERACVSGTRHEQGGERRNEEFPEHVNPPLSVDGFGSLQAGGAACPRATGQDGSRWPGPSPAARAGYLFLTTRLPEKASASMTPSPLP